MRKLLSAVLVMLLLLGAASAEVVTFQGIRVDVPAGVASEIEGDTLTLNFGITSMVLIKTLDMEALGVSADLISIMGEETVLEFVGENGFEKEGYPTELIEVDGKPCLMVDLSKEVPADMKGSISGQLIAIFGGTAALIQGIDFVNDPEAKVIEVLGMISAA